MVKYYSYITDKNKNVSEHFQVKEFASINGKYLYSDEVLVDTEIIDILEKLFKYMNAYKIVITSGYRTTRHEKEVGNKSGTGFHTLGQAVDINVWKNTFTRFTSQEIALALEDLEWKKGIGLITNTAVHIDSRTNKYYFNESNGNKTIGNSFYTFYNVPKIDKWNNVKEWLNCSDATIDYLKNYKYADDLYILLKSKM